MSNVAIHYEAGAENFLEQVVFDLNQGRLVVPIPPQLRDSTAKSLADVVTQEANRTELSGLVYMTSGTMGDRKLVVRSWESLLEEAQATAEALALSPRDHVVVSSPLSHSFGFAIALACTEVGAEVHAVRTTDNIFDRLHTIRRLASDSMCDVLTGVPFLFHSLMRGGADVFDKTRSYAGGDFIPQQLVHEWDNATGRPLRPEYGLSETGILTIGDNGDSIYNDSVGKPVQGVQFTFTDEDELVVSRPFLPDRYLLGDSPATFDNDGVHTGDLGYLVHGRLHLIGRKKNIIVVGGMKVVPEEIERAIRSHINIRDALVIGREHPRRGGQPVAYVQLEAGVHNFDRGSMRTHLRNTLEDYKIPAEYVVVPELPRNESGKVARS